MIFNYITYQNWRLKLCFKEPRSLGNMVRKKLDEKNHVNFFRFKLQQQNTCISIILSLINWEIPFAFTLCRNRKETLVKTHIKPAAEENKRQLSLLWGWLAGSVLSSRLNFATKSVVTSRFHLRFRKAQIMEDWFSSGLWDSIERKYSVTNILQPSSSMSLLGWGERNSLAELSTKLSRKKVSALVLMKLREAWHQVLWRYWWLHCVNKRSH